MSYTLLKALHIIAVVAWFAGLFYIFRLFVYHVENRGKAEIEALLSLQERRLLRIICVPAMVLTTAFGGWMLAQAPLTLQQPWFHVKAGALVLLFGYQAYAFKVHANLVGGRCTLSSKQCRLINELPSVLLIVIVLMVVLKPGFG